jgi:excisionase family DNA binding protein
MAESEDSKLIFYTTAEIAELLKMNSQVIARKLTYGELIGYKIGKDWRVSETDLLAWLEKHSNRYVRDPGMTIINRFLKDGKFKTLPVQRKKRIHILQYILERFEQNRVYSEKEVNDIITELHDDYCRIRREFVDEGMMSRKDGLYRRNISYKFIK